MARYKQLTCPEEIRIAERGTKCAVQFLWLWRTNRARAANRWLFCLDRGDRSRGTGRLVNPKRVELQRTEAHRKMYEQHFQCP